MSMSKELVAFLAQWYSWACAGGKEGEPFHNNVGLCSNARAFAGYSVYSELLYVLLEEFESAGAAYPFGEKAYFKARREGNQHQSPERLAWVEKKLKEAGVA